MAITSGWAFAVFAGVFTAIAYGSADAHLNPAVTLGAAVVSGALGVTEDENLKLGALGGLMIAAIGF